MRFPRATHLVVGFEYGYEAEAFFTELPERLAKFNLELAMDKSAVLRFSRFDLKGSKRFVYLGFDFYWARTRSGKLAIKRRTNKKKYRAALLSLKEWLKGARSLALKKLAPKLRNSTEAPYAGVPHVGICEVAVR